jgi:hypothetical protein
VANAYWALAAGDTSEATSRFAEVRTWPWEPYYRERLVYAQLLARTGRDRDAARILNQIPVPQRERSYPGEVLWQLERGRVHERLGNPVIAERCYRYVVDVWRNADPRLGVYLRQAREGLRRITGTS